MGGLIPTALLVSAIVGARAPQDPDAWTEARRLGPGAERASAIGRALNDARDRPQELGERLVFAHATFLEDLFAFRNDSTLTIAESMYEVDPRLWAAFCVEGISRRMEDYERAEAVLAELSATDLAAVDRVAALERRAIVAAGAGWREREQDFLGRAAALGGSDAYQMLARLALAAGERDRARTLFRVLLERHLGTPEGEAASPAWALRGWGLALLPPAPDPTPTAPR